MIMQKESHDKESRLNSIKSKTKDLQKTGIRINNMLKINADSTLCIALNGAYQGSGVISIIK